MNEVHRTIVFFDDECLLCNRALQWIVRNETTQIILFAPLNGAHADVLLKQYDILPDSIIALNDTAMFMKSNAIIHILEQMGGRWKVISIIMRIIPRYCRDFIYDFIANNRYTWFGRTNECLLKSGPHNNRCLD